MKQILNTLILSVNVQIIYIIQIYTFITCQLFPIDKLFAADLSTG